jgi:hypothetical protein
MASTVCRSLTPRQNLALVETSNSATLEPSRIISASPAAPKFDAEFLERRMQLHREQMAAQTALLATEIILEVSIALDATEELWP